MKSLGLMVLFAAACTSSEPAGPDLPTCASLGCYGGDTCGLECEPAIARTDAAAAIAGAYCTAHPSEDAAVCASEIETAFCGASGACCEGELAPNQLELYDRCLGGELPNACAALFGMRTLPCRL